MSVFCSLSQTPTARKRLPCRHNSPNTEGTGLPASSTSNRIAALNDRAYWRNVPASVWGYRLGGYQVLKKWLSYRERKVLGRSLLPEEVQHFTDTARRIAAILEIVTQKQ